MKVREALQQLAGEMPPAQPPADLWRRGRFRRRRSQAVMALTLVLVTAGAVALWPTAAGQNRIRDEVTPAGPGTKTWHVGSPWFWQADFAESAPGPAALVYVASPPGGYGVRFMEGMGVVVGRDGRYRTVNLAPADPFAFARLSPDGRYLAHADHLTDLRSGTSLVHQRNRGVVPAAWSRDGRQILGFEWSDQPYLTEPPNCCWLTLQDPLTGATRRLLKLGGDWFMARAAISPDGTKAVVSTDRPARRSSRSTWSPEPNCGGGPARRRPA